MFVKIHHQILDARLWEESSHNVMAILEAGRQPKGLKALMYLPSVDGRQADCLWEADTMQNLKSFVEGQTANAAKNDYFQVNVDAAVGLPGHEQPQAQKESPVEEAMHMAM